jgi:hypothetical protein
MGSVSSTSSNLSNLLQALGAESPALASVLSTSKMQSALGTNGANPSSTANPIASSTSSLQAQELESLFGSPQTVDPFLNTLG